MTYHRQLPQVKTRGAITFVYITQRNGFVHRTVWDTEIWEEFKNYAVCIQPNKGKFYVQITDADGVTHQLHRVIMNTHRLQTTDHIYGNGLDNRCSQLRNCTQAENNQNVSTTSKKAISGIRGVSWDSINSAWYASVWHDKKSNYLGRFDNLTDAAAAIVKFKRVNKPFSIHRLGYVPTNTGEQTSSLV